MTVITKPISEKKTDKLEEPLVSAEVLPAKDLEEGSGEKFAGAPPLPLPNYLAPWNPPRAARRSSISTLCLLSLALFVMSVGIITGLFVYRQFARPGGMHYSFRGSCQIPFNDRLINDRSGNFDKDSESKFAVNELFKELFMLNDLPDTLKEMTNGDPEENEKMLKKYLQEDVEIGGDDVEKIYVPDLYGSDRNKFIHDFNMNLTAIVDISRHYCFIMPLNRSQTLPPDDFADLIGKMWKGYYDLNYDLIRETMRVVFPAVEDRKNLGIYIQQECEEYPIYRLEKLVSGVVKRSITGEPAQFVQFAGKTSVLSIVNMDELKAYEKNQ
uniref:Integral membrane protein 2 n=1 Tax=Clastoptera arizonana TaxID=38151 RepID=A0A1B6C639_9HEMI